MKHYFLFTEPLTIIFAFVLLTTSAAAQSIHADQLPQKISKIYKEGIKLSRLGKTTEAIKKLDQVLKKAPTFHEASLRKATLLYEQNEYSNAAAIFEEVIAKDPAYDVEMYYAAAMTYLKLKQHDKGVAYLKKYIAFPNIEAKKKENCESIIKTNEFRIEALKNPKPYVISPVLGLVNSKEKEFLPSITLDGQQMIFSRRYSTNDELLISKKSTDGTWAAPIPLFDKNALADMAAHSISPDGQTIVLTSCYDKISSYGGCDLYISWYEGGAWSKPKNLGSTINTPAWESQPCLANNGNTLYFSSSRIGGVGANDLYVSQRLKNNKWSTPKNLGPVVNTTGSEESPFMHPDGKTLYFRSTGHIGMGSFDLFYARYDDTSQSWSKPINMGYPLNTEGQEGSLFVDRDGKTAYYATDAENIKKNIFDLDIYTFLLPEQSRAKAAGYVKISIQDQNQNPVTQARYHIIDLNTRDTVSSGTNTGPIVIALPENKNYAFHVNKQEYYFHSENFNSGEGFDIEKPFLITIALKPIIKIPEKAIVLNNIFFETGSATLLSESSVEVNNLITFLQSNKTMKIKIIGHTDDVGQDQDNLLLSQNRAKAVYEALLAGGIKADRLSYEGRGETQPIASNATVEGRKKNRRTEFSVIQN